MGLGELQGAGPLAKRPFEIGVSGVVGQIRTTPPPPDPRVVADVWGVAVDGRMMFSPNCGLAGEFYTGKTLGSYNGGVRPTSNCHLARKRGAWDENATGQDRRSFDLASCPLGQPGVLRGVS